MRIGWFTHEVTKMPGTELVHVRVRSEASFTDYNLLYKEKKMGCLKTKLKIKFPLRVLWIEKKYMLACVSGEVRFKGVAFTSMLSCPPSQRCCPAQQSPSRSWGLWPQRELISLLKNNAPDVYNPLKCINVALCAISVKRIDLFSESTLSSGMPWPVPGTVLG